MNVQFLKQRTNTPLSRRRGEIYFFFPFEWLGLPLPRAKCFQENRRVERQRWVPTRKSQRIRRQETVFLSHAVVNSNAFVFKSQGWIVWDGGDRPTGGGNLQNLGLLWGEGQNPNWEGFSLQGQDKSCWSPTFQNTAPKSVVSAEDDSPLEHSFE